MPASIFLCEKPLVLTALETLEVIAVVHETKVLCMEALMYRHHPFIHEIKQIVDSQELGEIRHLNAFYSANIMHLANAESGGSIRNLGCYPLSFVQYLLKQGPTNIYSTVRRGDDTMVRQASIMLQYPGYITATMSTADDIDMAWHFDIFATKAHLQILSNPWLPGQSDNYAVIKDNSGQIVKHVATKAKSSLYCYQIDSLGRALLNSSERPALISLEESLAYIQIMERWLQE